MKNRAIHDLLSVGCAVVLLLCAAGCGAETLPETSADTEKGTEADNAAPAETEASAYSSAFPETDMDGFTLRFCSIDQDKFNWSDLTILAERDGEVFNDAICDRNAYLEDTYNCHISVETQPDFDGAYFPRMVLSGDDAYDVCLLYDMKSVSFAESVLSWTELPYVDLSEECWNPGATGTFLINGNQLFTAGNSTMTYLSRVMCYLFNKNLYRELAFDENLYALVKDGKWTHDVFFRLSAEAVADLNGDGEYNVHDRCGYFGNKRGYYNSLIGGTDLHYVTQDEKGYCRFALADDERMISLFDRIIANDTANPHLTYNTGKKPHELIPDNLFENGQALFHVQGLPQTIAKLRAMEDEFGILPLPKEDEAQTQYHTLAYGGVLSALPKSLPEERYENIGLLMEAMTRKTQELVVPVYKETLLKTKYSRDAESSDVVDIMFSTVVFDPGVVLWCGEITDVICADIFMTGSKSVASYFSSKTKLFQSYLDNLNKICE